MKSPSLFTRSTLFIASGFGAGYLRPFAGTWGSILPLVLGWFVATTLSQSWLLLVTLAVIPVAFYSSHIGQREWGHDAKRITIDEFAGMLVTILGLPTIWWVYLMAFVSFRVCDILKPPPARQLEKLPGGWGVTADDLAAAIYANIIVRIILAVTS